MMNKFNFAELNLFSICFLRCVCIRFSAVFFAHIFNRKTLLKCLHLFGLKREVRSGNDMFVVARFQPLIYLLARRVLPKVFNVFGR